ncbi:MAG: TM0106 family RecB-like putative nuclease [Acidobacteria bacterium]|nr:TM0106 family RecB-like putative nuclease [Acidobacteriota bacterium]
MRVVDGRLMLAPTDLSTFLNCRHRLGLELAAAHGVLRRPMFTDPYAALLQQRGAEHEAAYVASLRAQGLSVVDLSDDAGNNDGGLLSETERQIARTMAAMRNGVDVIVQARLASDDLAGYADVLRRVQQPSALGAWSYEPYDTKLSRETKGASILQLCAYAGLLEQMQGARPAHFHVVTPDPQQPVQSYRVQDYAAYYRAARRGLDSALAEGHETLHSAHYPEPVEHCAVCTWEARCERRRRDDDHLSFIAGAGRTHRDELTAQGHSKLIDVAQMSVPVTFKPRRGSRETYDRLGHQARVQFQQRTGRQPVVERLPIVPGEGLARLPEPSPGDMFLDLEGARFAREGGREFLFGLFDANGYRAWWAMTDAEEKQAFEAVMDAIASAWRDDPGMHVYHYNHYEPTAFKKLVGRHVTREEPLNQLLRAERFVDLYPIVRQSVRCGVESYSIKRLEQYSGYERQVALASASQPLLAVEMALESGMTDAVAGDIRDAVQGYNEDHCRSTRVLRDWLERQRADAIAEGEDIPRPVSLAGEATPALTELQQQVEALRSRLLALADDRRWAHEPAEEDGPRQLRTLAYLIDWHRREENAEWWEYFRLKELPAEDLFDERDAIAGLAFVKRLGPVIGKTGKPTRSVRDRYTYPPQEIEIGAKGKLHARDGKGFGSVVAHDRLSRLIDIEKGPLRADDHPSEVFACDVISTKGPQLALMRLAGQVADEAAPPALPHGTCGESLLFRHRPRLSAQPFSPAADEDATAFAVRIVTTLDRTTLAIQGPPGAGKTYAGAQMIRALVRAGKRVGVTATSHKVIRNLLDEVAAQAARAGDTGRLGAKVGEVDEDASGIVEFDNNEDALTAIGGTVDVLGGTAWLWSREDAANTVDVLFVDEAGQMSLANVVAVSSAAGSLVLLGDPQQLDQPQKASHPDGVGVSALQHVLGDAETMPADRGIFLPITYRMAPAITEFTSEVFYAGALMPAKGLDAQRLTDTSAFTGAGLCVVEVPHSGNQTVAMEEVERIAALVDDLLRGRWVDHRGATHPITPDDLRIVAPFNAQVNRLKERLPLLADVIGTVDRFQGQTAAVVIYSMTTSRADEAPRGMEFLYSLNRLNVATSRARCAAFVVCAPDLLRPECRTPRQMRLANALCRFAERSAQLIGSAG